MYCVSRPTQKSDIRHLRGQDCTGISDSTASTLQCFLSCQSMETNRSPTSDSFSRFTVHLLFSSWVERTLCLTCRDASVGLIHLVHSRDVLKVSMECAWCGGRRHPLKSFPPLHLWLQTQCIALLLLLLLLTPLSLCYSRPCHFHDWYQRALVTTHPTDRPNADASCDCRSGRR
jgi:hypothetical protein